MKKSKIGTYFLICGLAVILLVVATTLVLATHTRAGALCVMILKALDMETAYAIAAGAVIAGTATAVFAVSRLLSVPAAEELQNDGAGNDNAENINDEN